MRFINNSGLGFDALICERVNHSKFKRMLNRFNLGKLVYVYYVLLELIRFKPFQLKVETENGIKTFENVWFIAASNQPYFGGGMKISPHSNAEDGKLEYTVIHHLSKWRFIMIFLKVFRGNHLGYKQYVEQFQGQICQAYAEKPLFGHVDGEVFTVQSNETLYFSVGDYHLKYAVDPSTIIKKYVDIV
ncbi:diacylglycerol/lipid kinase family protein [Amphibacillus sp. Q70]|uniref:diacylglycerol/lipid kinase family protein n=1 Tax=Amphibacillus sp. Q70 TaxID=3453416 RepID=UPI003F82727F